MFKFLYQEYTQIDPVLTQAVDILQKAAANTSGLTGIPTGYTRLDDITAGWQASDLVIIAGRPAMGQQIVGDAVLYSGWRSIGDYAR